MLKKNTLKSSFDDTRYSIIKKLMIVAIVILIFDIYGSIENKYYYMSMMEGIALGIIGMGFLALTISPRHVKIVIYLILSSITLVIILSLTIEGHNKEFALFSLAIVPMYIFFFLGVSLGIYWSIIIVFLLVLSTLNAVYIWVTPIFSIDLLLQTTVSYVVLTYLYYKMEEKKNAYDSSLSNMVHRRTVLLKELHHRSKNNLHLIMGLLESQAMFTANKECKVLLTSQRSRLKAMSLVHDNLSGEAHEEKIEMSEYLEQICRYIRSYSMHHIVSDFNALKLIVEDGMNIGLFFNEALTNAIEHAYLSGEVGKIEVSLIEKKDYYILMIKDYGRGFQLSQHRDTLGLTLMEDICDFLPNSFLEIDFSEGTEIKATFTKI